MSNASATSDEEIIWALLSNGTIKAAAKSLGIGERSIYRRMHDDEFIKRYEQVKQEILRSAVNKLNKNLDKAIDVITEVMTDESSGAKTRLQAADMVIRYALLFSDRLDNSEQNDRDRETDPFYFL